MDCSDIFNSILQDIWNYEIKGKQYFPKNLKLADITPVYKKKVSTLDEIYWPVSALTLHKKRSLSLRISSVNVTKSAVSCRFGYIY